MNQKTPIKKYSNQLDILEALASGGLSVAEAQSQLSTHVESLADLGILDFKRFQRCGVPEVIFGEGKSVSQLKGIIQQFLDRGANVFATRISAEKSQELISSFPELIYHRHAHAVTQDVVPLPEPVGQVCIVTAGSSDETPAAEAALTAERMGARTVVIRDVGVAGVHRLFERLDEIRQANVVIAVAGMEAALVSVLGGLIDRPMIALPTSVGYGLHLNGLTSFLAMLNSCVPGAAVVNIDNGFGAGIAAAQINRLAVGDHKT